jgi:SAM-dependent methyltransferase
MLARAGRHPLDLVDLGCGGGWEFLTRYGHVTGIDNRGAPLAAAAGVYVRAVQASVEHLPLADACADAVVSVWLVEHLAEPAFVAVLREVRRVLRPGGRFVFLADLDSAKPILRWAKQHPGLYVRHQVEAVGHHGLRTLPLTRYILQREGFAESETVPVSRSSVLQPITARWMLDNELGRRSRTVRAYLAFCRIALRMPRLYRAVYHALMEYHRWVDRRLPERCAFTAAFDWIVPETLPPSLGTPGGNGRAAEVPGGASARDSAVVAHADLDPWTGLPVDPDCRGRRPVAVIVDNAAGAHPQEGLAAAAVVIEAPIEGGLTRLLAIFTRAFPVRVGPVRSARPYLVHWAGAWQAFLMHSGASPQARTLLENPAGVIGLECVYHLRADGTLELRANADAFLLDPGRPRPHHIFARPAEVVPAAGRLRLRVPAPLAGGDLDALTRFAFDPGFRFRDHPEAAAHEPVTVQVRTRPASPYPTRFEWDAQAAGFRRSVLGTPVGEAGTRDRELVIANLLLIWTRVARITGDLRGRIEIASGGGRARAWLGPRVRDATWERVGDRDVLRFRDPTGQPLVLRRGLTWIMVLEEDSVVLAG